MKQPNHEQVYQHMVEAIDDIYVRSESFPWGDRKAYTLWLAQSYYYVAWTTRQLALASAHTDLTQDAYHWRFIEEAKEEKAHEKLVLADLEALGETVNDYPELPHSAFFYQTLSYMIERVHPISILGYSLTLEGFAAKKAKLLYPMIEKAHGKKASTFFKTHTELDEEHFANALPYLKSCSPEELKVVDRAIRQCHAIYIGILDDIEKNLSQSI